MKKSLQFPFTTYKIISRLAEEDFEKKSDDSWLTKHNLIINDYKWHSGSKINECFTPW